MAEDTNQEESDPNAPKKRIPLGARLAPAEWISIIATCLTMLTTLGTAAYLAGAYNTRLSTVEGVTKDLPVTIQVIKGNLENLQSLKDEVKALNKIENRVSFLEAKVK